VSGKSAHFKNSASTAASQVNILKPISATEFDWIRSSAEQNLHD